jgi:hypothetical protein
MTSVGKTAPVYQFLKMDLRLVNVSGDIDDSLVIIVVDRGCVTVQKRFFIHF